MSVDIGKKIEDPLYNFYPMEKECNRTDYNFGLYITPEEKRKMDEICAYEGISRSKFVMILIDHLYETLLDYGETDVEELAKKHKVGHGVVSDLTGIFD